MNTLIEQILESNLSKEYLAITDEIASIDEQLAKKIEFWWKNAEPALTKREQVALRAKRQLLAKALLDVTARINGDADFSNHAQVGISVDVCLPVKK